MTDRVQNIDALRYISATMVVLSHCLNEYGIYGFGGSFVDVFFVISGFVIAGTPPKNFNIIRFLKKRILRIYPSYLIATSLTVIAIYFTDKEILLNDLFRSIILIPSFGEELFYPILKVGWSLAYEMFFYITFAAALYIQCYFKVRVVSVIFPVCAYLLADTYILEFWAGYLLYQLYQLKPNQQKENNLFFYLITFLGALLIGYAEIIKSMQSNYSTYFLFVGAVFLVGGTFLIPYNNKTLSWLGKKTSYEVYLYHPLIINTVVLLSAMANLGIEIYTLFLVSMLIVHVMVFFRQKIFWLPGD